MSSLLLISAFALQPLHACNVQHAPSQTQVAGSADVAVDGSQSDPGLEPGAIIERGTSPPPPTEVQRSTSTTAEQDGKLPNTEVVFHAPAAPSGAAADGVVERASVPVGNDMVDC